jgi:hypothetical protein
MRVLKDASLNGGGSFDSGCVTAQPANDIDKPAISHKTPERITRDILGQ